MSKLARSFKSPLWPPGQPGSRSSDSRPARAGVHATGDRTSLVPGDVLDEAARRLRVLGHPLRLRLLDVLAGGPRSVTDLARLLETEHQMVSKHLSELLHVGVVRRQQDGNFALYSLPDALTIKAVALLCRSVAQDRARVAGLATTALANRNGVSH